MKLAFPNLGLVVVLLLSLSFFFLFLLFSSRRPSSSLNSLFIISIFVYWEYGWLRGEAMGF